VLLADRQTTGGYPKIATVISADVPALGRVPVGSKISFESVTLQSALEIRRMHVEELKQLPNKLRPILHDGSN
jgi:allophanate hydrolase